MVTTVDRGRWTCAPDGDATREPVTAMRARELRRTPDVAFTRELDSRAAAGFPRRRRFGAVRDRLRVPSLLVPGTVLGGVCAGIGRRFGLGPWVSRLLFLVLLMVLPGSQLLVYPVLWFLMPSDDSAIALANRPHAGG